VKNPRSKYDGTICHLYPSMRRWRSVVRIAIKMRGLVPFRRDFDMERFITKAKDSKTTMTSRNLMELF